MSIAPRIRYQRRVVCREPPALVGSTRLRSASPSSSKCILADVHSTHGWLGCSSGDPGSRPADRHELDPGYRAEQRPPAVLHHGLGQRAAPSGTRGRPQIYGERRIDLAKRAGQRRGWVTGRFIPYRKVIRKRYKTFVTTGRPASGAIRVALKDESKD